MQIMYKKIIFTAAILAVLAVILGAFGAHSLKAHLTADRIAIFETGIRYQFYHVFGLLLIAVLYQNNPSRHLLKWAAYFMIAGIFFFSGSLYLLACRHVLGIATWTWLGPMTPIGGIFFIIAWGVLAYAFWRK